MNHFLLYLLLAFSLTDITGNWRETRRATLLGTDVPFADTTFYEFKTGNEWLRGRKNSFQYRGVYKLDENTLDLGIKSYKILSLSRDKMELQDEGARYTFERYELPATDPSQALDASGSTGRAQEATELHPPASLKEIRGKWQPFKRTSAKTLDKVDYSRLIKTCVVYNAPKEGKLGVIYAGLDASDAPSWYLESFHNGVLSATRRDGSDRRSIKVLSYKDGELILQEGAITYFLKQF